MILIAVLGCNNVEVAAPVTPASGAAVGLHLNRDSTGTVWVESIVRVIVIDAHLGRRDGGGI